MEFPTTSTELRKFLERRGIRVGKRLGQHFLVDRNMLRWIAGQGELGPGDVVLEVGTGTGLLTNELAQQAGQVVTVEIDERMFDLSGKFLAGHDNIRRCHADILEKRDRLNPEIIAAVEETLEKTPRSRLKIVANIPYNISSPLIIDMLESGLPLERMILTIQWEVAERLTASPGTKDYGYLTVIAEYHSEIDILKQIPRQVFWPRPKVTSAVVRLLPKKHKYPLRDYGMFHAIARAIFDHRRKNLLNSLALGEIDGVDKAGLRDILAECGLDPASRGEALTVEHICRLADTVFDLRDKPR